MLRSLKSADFIWEISREMGEFSALFGGKSGVLGVWEGVFGGAFRCFSTVARYLSNVTAAAERLSNVKLRIER